MGKKLQKECSKSTLVGTSEWRTFVAIRICPSLHTFPGTHAVCFTARQSISAVTIASQHAIISKIPAITLWKQTYLYTKKGNIVEIHIMYKPWPMGFVNCKLCCGETGTGLKVTFKIDWLIDWLIGVLRRFLKAG